MKAEFATSCMKHEQARHGAISWATQKGSWEDFLM